MCKDSPVTAEFLLSNKSLLASVTPPNYMLCASVVSLCQQLFLPEQIEKACLILVADCTCVCRVQVCENELCIVYLR